MPMRFALASIGLLVVNAQAAAQEEIHPFEKRIISCEPSRIEDHNWQVAFSVKYPDGKTYLCGGSIIYGKWVLTAAHCFPTPDKPRDGRAKTGVTNIVLDGEWTEIARVVRHENYNAKTQENDLALVKLRSTPKGKQIDLIEDDQKLSVGQILQVTGWGITETGTPSDTLCMTTVPYVDNATCNAANSYNGAIKPSMMCAGYAKGGKDSCGGDSGGPLVWRLNGRAILVGVVSFGEGCALQHKYGVYTRVSAYRDWIDRVISTDRD
ncbi:serine protease [Bradyrhizobium oligotrophicum]|uniref:serine protease n=1 Tax=Bradyrhizobium oligotrophicum TaxID=44255 RepID=UPI003EBF7E1E